MSDEEEFVNPLAEESQTEVNEISINPTSVSTPVDEEVEQLHEPLEELIGSEGSQEELLEDVLPHLIKTECSTPNISQPEIEEIKEEFQKVISRMN